MARFEAVLPERGTAEGRAFLCLLVGDQPDFVLLPPFPSLCILPQAPFTCFQGVGIKKG